MKIVTQTHTGRRDHNEDVVRELKSRHYRGVLVSDGMGGALAGEVAAAMVADGMEAVFLNLPKGDPVPTLLEAVRHVNREIYAASTQDPDREGMGATLVMALTDGRSFWVLHVGDSRCYRLKDGEIEQITRDHSAVQDSIDRGVMTADEAVKTPWKNALLQCMGSDVDPNPGVTGPEPFSPGTVLLLCSDGLSGFVSEMEILETLMGTRNGTAAAEHLIRRAWANGSDDNISVCLMEQGSFHRQKSPIPALPPIPKPKRPGRNRKWLVGTLLAAIVLLLGLLGFAGWWWLGRPDASTATVSVETVAPVPASDPAVKPVPAAVFPEKAGRWTSEKVAFDAPFGPGDVLRWERQGFDEAELILLDSSDNEVLRAPVGRKILLQEVAGGHRLKGLYDCVLRFSDKRESGRLSILIREGAHRHRKKTKRAVNTPVRHPVSRRMNGKKSNFKVTGTEKTYHLPLKNTDCIEWVRSGFSSADVQVQDPREHIRQFHKIKPGIRISELTDEKPVPGRYLIQFRFSDGVVFEKSFTIGGANRHDTGPNPMGKGQPLPKSKLPGSTLKQPLSGNGKPGRSGTPIKNQRPAEMKSPDSSPEKRPPQPHLLSPRPGEPVFSLPLTPGYFLKIPQKNSNKIFLIHIRFEGGNWGKSRIVGKSIKLIDLLGKEPKAGRYEYQLWPRGQKPGTGVQTFILQGSRQ